MVHREGRSIGLGIYLAIPYLKVGECRLGEEVRCGVFLSLGSKSDTIGGRVLRSCHRQGGWLRLGEGRKSDPR